MALSRDLSMMGVIPLALAALLLASDSALAAPAGGHLTISVSSTRPVLSAIEELEQRHGYIINYEEIEGAHSDARTVDGVLPRPESLYVAYETDQDGTPPDPDKLIAEVARLGSVDGRRFDSWRSGPMTFYLVDRIARDRAGREVPFTPLLDTRISFPAVDRDLDDFLHVLCKAIKRERDFSLSGPGMSKNYLFQHRTGRGARAEVARDVLTSVLAGFKERISYRLLHSFGGLEDQAAYLDVDVFPPLPSRTHPAPCPASTALLPATRSPVLECLRELILRARDEQLPIPFRSPDGQLPVPCQQLPPLPLAPPIPYR